MAKLVTICPVCENDISIASREIQLAVRDWSARDMTKKKKKLAASEKKVKIEEVRPRKIGLEAWL